MRIRIKHTGLDATAVTPSRLVKRKLSKRNGADAAHRFSATTTVTVMDPPEKTNTTNYSSSTSIDAVSFTNTHSENVPSRCFGNDA